MDKGRKGGRNVPLADHLFQKVGVGAAHGLAAATPAAGGSRAREGGRKGGGKEGEIKGRGWKARKRRKR